MSVGQSQVAADLGVAVTLGALIPRGEILPSVSAARGPVASRTE
jgi:hypothetical protein